MFINYAVDQLTSFTDLYVIKNDGIDYRGTVLNAYVRGNNGMLY